VRKSSVNLALVISPFPGVIASVLPYYLLIQIPHQAQYENLMPVFLVTGGLAFVSLCLAAILDIGRNESEQKLQKLVDQFSRENKLFEQRMWVAQHLWYTLLHGTVQSALTAAMIRSSNKDSLTEADKKAIIQDLNRGIDALRKPAKEEVKLDDALVALKTTWTDIAEIDLSIKPEAKTKIVDSTNGTLVVNELLKEVVSNAVKHGSASKIQINVELNSNGDVAVLVSNNGSKPINVTKTGVGSTLFSNLCTGYSLTWNSSTGTTEFRATIPMA
jgi:two-component sensor histidine kinase